MNKKFFFILGGIVIIAGVSVFFLFRKNTLDISPSLEKNTPQEQLTNTSQDSAEKISPPVNDFPNDQDHDGVTDTQEKEMGLSDTQFDSDADGITDYNEINTFHTDPAKKDTDGDGFADGYEVSKGYNPNGPGKLETSQNQ